MSADVLVDRYELGERLGTGGMSTVRLAFDRRLERDVAVKILAEHLAEDRQFVSRFRREALSAAQLVHPNIVQVFDFGHDKETDRYFIVMEAVIGQSGAQLLRERGYLSVPETVKIITDTAKGLDHAHRGGVIHRDVKPGNILIGKDGSVKIADFGIAKAMSEASASITQIGSVIGTASYLAPEQAAGEDTGPEADIYSLGVVTYQMLAARLPYEADSLAELALKQQREAPPLLDQLNAEVVPELGLVVDRALNLDPRMRYSSANLYGQAIADGADGIGPDISASKTRIVDPSTGATRVIRRETAAQMEREFDTTGEFEDYGTDRTQVRPTSGRAAARTSDPYAGAPRAARAPRRAQEGQQSYPAPQNKPVKKRPGFCARMFRLVLVMALLAAIIGGIVWYVAKGAIEPELEKFNNGDAPQLIQDIKDYVKKNAQ